MRPKQASPPTPATATTRISRERRATADRAIIPTHPLHREVEIQAVIHERHVNAAKSTLRRAGQQQSKGKRISGRGLLSLLSSADRTDRQLDPVATQAPL